MCTPVSVDVSQLVFVLFLLVIPICFSFVLLRTFTVVVVAVAILVVADDDDAVIVTTKNSFPSCTGCLGDILTTLNLKPMLCLINKKITCLLWNTNPVSAGSATHFVVQISRYINGNVNTYL